MTTDSKNLTAFLSMIGWSEHTTTSPATKHDGYDVIVTGIDGQPEIFTDFSRHPFDGRDAKVLNHKGLASTAAGRYQLLFRWWMAYAVQLGLKDFSPASQDAVAIQQIRERGALPLIYAGSIELAIHRCSNIWASFPGAGYGQHENEVQHLLDAYTKAGGSICQNS
jgi:muramidase (phage lysozyme)